MITADDEGRRTDQPPDREIHPHGIYGPWNRPPERIGQLMRRLVAHRRIFLQAFHDDPLDLGRDVCSRVDLLHRRWFLPEVSRCNGQRAAGEWKPAREELIK